MHIATVPCRLFSLAMSAYGSLESATVDEMTLVVGCGARKWCSLYIGVMFIVVVLCCYLSE